MGVEGNSLQVSIMSVLLCNISRLTQITKRIDYIPVQYTSPENHDDVNGALIFERSRKTRWLLPWHRKVAKRRPVVKAKFMPYRP